MSDETVKVGINERVLEDCKAALERQGISSRRNEEVLELLEKSLVDDNLIETLTREVLEERNARHKKLDEETLGRLLRGHIFESVALESLPREEEKYGELERFCFGR